MDPKIIKKTQDTLGKIIKKPPLTDKLLGKPPFRFLHDVMTSVIKTTGFMQGLYTEVEMNSENVKERDAKISFLQKAIDIVSAVTGKSLGVKPMKVVAGHEPEKTNEFLQALAEAINKNVDNDDYVRRVLKGGGDGEGRKESAKESSKDERKEKDRDRTKSADRRRARETEEKERRDKDKDKEEKGDKESRHDRDRDKDKEKDKERHKERESKTRERSRDGREERHRDKGRRREHSKEKENESPSRVNGQKEEKQEPPSRPQRPSSAKGSRRRREEDEEFQKKLAPSKDPVMGEDDLPPQIAAARQLARPSSARPAPPRPKQETNESEPAMRLGTGQPTNLIVDNNDEDEDDDENFLVEESAPPPVNSDPTPLKPPEEEDAEHGALVKKMLESKKEVEAGNQAGQPKKTEIERPVMSDAQRRKQREQVQKEVEKLRGSIQSLTRSANPLGKVMDYVQEDLDSMQQELDKWRAENAQHALDLKREMNVTDRAIEPLRQQLSELERGIADQLDQIAATKANIIKNDLKIEKMLKGITKS